MGAITSSEHKMYSLCDVCINDKICLFIRSNLYGIVFKARKAVSDNAVIIFSELYIKVLTHYLFCFNFPLRGTFGTYHFSWWSKKTISYFVYSQHRWRHFFLFFCGKEKAMSYWRMESYFVIVKIKIHCVYVKCSFVLNALIRQILWFANRKFSTTTM